MKQRFRFIAGACLFGAGLAATGADQARAAESIAWIEDLGVRPEVPLVALPAAAGSIIGIDVQRKTDAYIQTITLEGDHETIGENQVIVTVTRNGLAPRMEQDTLDSEIADRLPDMHMMIGPSDTRNAIGIFGSAIGSKGPLNCLYAWQSVNLADQLITGKDAGFFGERHSLSIRFRLCRTTMTAAGLLQVVGAAQSGSQGAAIMNVTMGRDALSAAAGLTPMTVRMTGEALASPNLAMGAVGDDFRDAPRPRVKTPRKRVYHARALTAPDAPETARRVPMAGMPSVPLPQ